MALSTFALLIGLTSYLFGLPMLLTEKKASAWFKKFLKSNEQLISILGGAIFLVAAVTLRRQWELTFDAEGLVVLMAWLTAVKGLYLAWQPMQYSKMAVGVLSNHSLELLWGFFAIVWGALFTYLGFVLA